MNLNQVVVAGNLTRDPELRYSKSGTAVAPITIAVNHKYKTKTGETKEDVTFVDVTFFDKKAEAIGKYFRKGDPIYVQGRLRIEQWEAKDGEKRSKLTVSGVEFQFVTTKKGGGGDDDGDRREYSHKKEVRQESPKRKPEPERDNAGDAEDDDFIAPF